MIDKLKIDDADDTKNNRFNINDSVWFIVDSDYYAIYRGKIAAEIITKNVFGIVTRYKINKTTNTLADKFLVVAPDFIFKDLQELDNFLSEQDSDD